jgi:hypothetical protein
MLTRRFFMLLPLIFLPLLIFGNVNEINNLSLSEVEIKLKRLHHILQQNYQDEMKEEVESQNFIIADWDKYAEEIQAIKNNEDRIRKIKQEIKELENRKAYLLQIQNKKSINKYVSI